MKQYLFTYGTLRKDYENKVKDEVKDRMTFIGRGKVYARLYDLSSYPGAVKSPAGAGNEVIGDLFLIDDPEKVLEVLDRYEGYRELAIEKSEFVRGKTRVRLYNGKSKHAWIYWYNFDPAGRQKIAYKDYLNYLRNKSTN